MTNLLESVQRKFTKRIPSVTDMSYSERLAFLKLESLELRRLRFDLINYFKFLSPGFSPELAKRFMVHHPHTAARSTIPRLIRPVKSSGRLCSDFFFRQVNVWNSLPDSLKASKSLYSFKSGLSKINFTQFLIGSCFK